MQTENMLSQCAANSYCCERTVGFDKGTECIEEPAMAVQFLLVLFLQAKDDLDGNGARRDLSSVSHHDVGRVLEDVRCHIFAGNRVLRNTVLVATHLNTSQLCV
jgi:hypothetical protein